LERRGQDVLPAVRRALQSSADRAHRAQLRLELLDPTLVLQRGYAWLALEDGSTLTRVAQAQPGRLVRATLTDGAVDLTVSS